MKFLFVVLALVAAASAMPLPLRSNTGDSISYTQLGKFSVSNPAFFLVAPFQIDYPAPSDCLFITSFTGNPFGSGEIYVVENITSYANDLSNLNPISLNLSFAWPNSISAIPSNVLSQLQLPNGILVPDGFLVPGKNNGGLYVVTSQPGSAPVKYQINDPSVDKGFFYHSAVWVDMNGDGRLDLLSAHANKPLFGSTQTGLVWFEQPVGGLNSLPWQQNVITVGPDVFFTILEMDGSSDTLEIIATEFFSSQLTLNVVSITAAQPGALVYRRVIDSTIGAAYHSDVVMLAGKGGVQELLVNNHQAASSNGVYAYSIPSDLKNGQFVRRTLASGFPVTEGGFNQTSPGFVYAVDPHMPSTGAAPYLMVAGDGAQSAYLLTPDSSSPPQYSSQTIIDVQGTVGSLFISDDWNGDGLREFLVPDYDHNVVYAYTFSS